MASKILQVKLDALEIYNRGPDPGNEDVTAVEFTLWYPFPGVNAVKTIKSIPVNKNIPKYDKEAWENRIVFKQEVAGEFVLEVKAVAVNNPNGFSQFLTQIFASGIKLAVGTITGGISNIVSNLVVSQIGTDISNNIEASGATKSLGQGKILLHSDNLPTKPETIELKMPAGQRLVKTIGNPGVGDVYNEEVLVKPEAKNGMVILDFQVL